MIDPIYDTEPNRDKERPCTCHPDDKPPVPCPRQYAITDCRYVAEITRLRTLLGRAHMVIEYDLASPPTASMAEALLAEIDEVLHERV